MEIITLGIDGGFTDSKKKDLSNQTGLALIKANTDTGKTDLLFSHLVIPDMKLEWVERIRKIQQEVRAIVWRWQVAYGVEFDCAGVEFVYLSKDSENVQTSLKLAALAGANMAAVSPYVKQVYFPLPSQAKKALSRNGSATKTEMMAAARKLYGKDRIGSIHEADACGNALAAAELYLAEVM